jgi:exonuclease SbcC
MSPPVRFVHCAGFHFDSRSWEGPVSWISMRNQDLWQTFEAVITLCQREKADFLFLTGNLFEQEYVRKETVERVARSLAKLDGTRVFIVPGECDPLVTTSAYRFTEWPDNVHIFHEGFSQIKIPSRRVSIYGSGWTTYRQEKNFLDDFQGIEKVGEIRFMLLHAEVDSVQNTERFIPLQEEQIASSDLTYLALGHKVNWSGIQQAGETYYADCGSAEARSFRDSGPHGVLLGETDGKSTQIKFLELGQRRYFEKSLLLQEGDLEALAAQLLADTTDQERKKDLFRLKLTGSFRDTEAVIHTLQKLLADTFSFIEFLPNEDETPSVLRSNIAPPDSIVGSRTNSFPAMTQIFINEIQKRLAVVKRDEEQRHWELVQKIGLAALTRQASLQDGEQKQTSDPETEDEKEVIVWQERKEDDYNRRIRNLRQVGDEQISLAQAWDSLTRATKRVEEQAESMGQIKAEYEVLRRDWESANRRQEEQRLLQIEIKNLQAKKNNYAEKIASAAKIKERLALIRQNPDYRELRKIHGELSRLEEVRLEAEAELTAYTRDVQVDWNMIEGLREECLQWASLQEEAEHLAVAIQQRAQEINELQNILQMSGYQKLPANEDQRLRQAEKKRDTVLAELEKFADLQDQIIRTEETYNKEISNLKDFAVLAGDTATDERRMVQNVQRLAKWQSSKVSGFFDRLVKEQLGRTSINDRLTAHLSRYYQKYHVADYDDFKRQQKEFHEQQQVVESLQTKLEQLRQEVDREKELRKIVHSRNQMLKQAYSRVKADDFTTWLHGWEDYRRKESQAAEMIDALHLQIEQQQVEEQKLTAYADQLREKLKNWASPVSNIDEVLEVVMKVARRLRAKEEAEKDFTTLKQGYAALLGKRNMDHLARTLEPLADLEREARLSDEQRQSELLAYHQELAETNTQLMNAENSLKHKRATPVISDLEKRLETLKLQWKTYEELQRALDNTKDLLEASRLKWQAAYGNALEAKAQRIFSRTFSSAALEKIDNLMAEAKQVYFAYRMALTQLALEDSPETPLKFFVEEMNETPVFWEDVLAYLQELSLSRQVIFRTSDAKLRQLVDTKGI